MTIDSSVLVAIILDEPERALFVELIDEANERLVSAVTLLEAGIVVENRRGEQAVANLELLIHKAEIQVVAFHEEQSTIAQRAYRKYGKGKHPAALNFGDCVAYALAKVVRRAIAVQRE